ncbi:DciA family protein [Streptomyces sp. NPDC048496]|uniref:DciA family protein n=1 Tax=Streptomyces sp. NPDC048496 TaxID=3365558 RepID=UPI003723C0BB
MTDQQPQTSAGADLARQALAAYKANAGSTVSPKKTPRRLHATRTGGREPLGLGDIVGQISTEQGWDNDTGNLRGGRINDQWHTLCPQFAGHVEPAGYDAERGRLDLRPGSHAYAAQLRLLGGQVARQINDKLGRPAVRSIRVLAVGALTTTPAVEPAPVEQAIPTGPVRTRETASPGYQRALTAALAHKPDTAPTSPYLKDAIDRQNQALTDLDRREPETAFADTVATFEVLTSGQPADSLQASIQAALDYKHGGGRPVRRAFDVA